ncbi:serine protease [Arthrobacter sp. MYb213]|uniref:S1 family peptidase n=1 Tax=Arthrobacter sp. MYb213 TaxID=1848595 RepID=UPI000CFB20EC|nr:serine protease [Arthrobacter sp. MYb213]PRB71336.1 hypothetical protein CQ011_05385 [Arthrobacter sp. MYb213]
MSNKILLPHILTQSIKITTLSADEEEIETGTGFTVTNLDATWLVTNRHVLIGRKPGTNEYTDLGRRQPTKAKITWVEDDLSSRNLVIELFSEDKSELWIEHPPLAHALDLVAIQVPSNTFVDVDLLPSPDDDPGYVVTSGDPIVVIGFPFGLSAGLDGLPIMFSGIVASPPGILINEQPRFLIDSRTRPGLSGSPVYYYPNASALRKGASNEVHFPSPKFLGLYCGRVNDDSDLGYVIDAFEIARTIVHKRPGVLFV